MATVMPIVAAYRRVDGPVARAIADAVTAWGVPVDVDTALSMAELLYPVIMRERHALVAQSAELIRADHPELWVPDTGPPYTIDGLAKMIMRAAGLTPDAQRTEALIFNEEYQRLERVRVAPWTQPNEPEVIQAFHDRIQAGASRHVRSADREMTTYTATKNGRKWARRTNGEACAFCAVLASRGAVYGVKYFQAHNHCDCSAEIAQPDGSFSGQDEADEYLAIWNESKSMTDYGKKLKEMRDDETVAA